MLLIQGALLSVEYQIGKQEAISGMTSYLRELTSHQAASIDGEFAVLAQAARSSAWFLDNLASPDAAVLEKLLHGNLAQSPLIYGSAIAFDPSLGRASPYLFRAAGEAGVRNIDIRRDAYDYTTWDWYRLPRESGAPLWTEPYFDKGAGDTLMVTYSAPLQQQKQFKGVVTVDVSLEKLRADMAQIRVKDGFLAIVSRRGAYLSHPQPARIMQSTLFHQAERFDLPELAAAARDMAAGKNGVLRLRDPEDGEGMHWLAYARISSTGWSLMAVVDEDLVLADVYQRLHRQLSVSLLGAALLLAILLLFTVRLTKPLVRLGETARQIAGGDFAARVEGMSGRDEIGRFATAFNHMLDRLAEVTEARFRESAERQVLEGELKAARGIQQSLLPHVFPPFPEHPGIDLYALCQPASTMSGDFYDFFLLDSATLVVTVADVCGKGVSAAMFMAVARTTLRNFSQPGRSPSEVLEAANQALVAENEGNMFVTLFYAHYDLSSGRLRYAVAGHPPPCLLRAGGELVYLTAPGALLGVFADARYATQEVDIARHDTLVLYTDGVTEAGAAALYGEARMEAVLQAALGRSAESLCRALADDVTRYSQGERQDDVTLLALRRLH